MADDRSIREVRLEKLQRMREMGCDPFAQEKFAVGFSAQAMLDRFDELSGSGLGGPPESRDAGEGDLGRAAPATVSFAGRVVSYRLMGKAGFAHLSDGDGKIQVYFRKDDLSETEWELYGLLDIGDHVGVTGELFLTKTGEKSIHARSLVVLSKCLQSLPLGKTREVKDEAGTVVGTERWYELEDTEQRYRHRHLDLLSNPEARAMLLNRARITTAVRHYFDSQGYLEVETPYLQVQAGGAHARPFTTHYNAYEMDMKLRISLELYLKRIICGDVPKVYEIGRVFRNEGLSSRHNPEFTLVEFYEAYANLEDMMRRMEECFRFVCLEVFGVDRMAPAWKPTRFPSNFAVRLGETTITFESEDSNLVIGEFVVVRDAPVDVVSTSLLEGCSVDVDLAEISLTMVSGGPVFTYLAESGLLIHAPEGATLSIGGPAQSVGRGWWVPISAGRAGGFMRMPNIPVTLDFSKPWRRVDLLSEIESHTGLTTSDLSDLSVALKKAAELGVPEKAKQQGGFIDLKKENNLGGFIEKLLEVFVEPTLQEPTFVVGYPIETSPLAKKDPNRPGFTRRFEGYVLGREICNAFSEINDPIDQRERFEDQLMQAAKGNDEAQSLDEEFIYALECGMPPTGGCGFGIDRMAMLLTGADHVREVLFFPTMRPEKNEE